MQKETDVFYVVSCVNPHDNALYPDHNPDHAAETRLAEVTETLRSIRSWYPEAHIVWLDNSTFPYTWITDISHLFDTFLPLSRVRIVKWSRRSNNKGVPHSTQLLVGLLRTRKRYPLTRQRNHFLTGRYVLDDQVFANVTRRGAYYFYYPEHRNVSVRYFVYNRLNLLQVAGTLTLSISLQLLLKTSMENVIFRSPLIPWTEVCRLGIHGRVNGITDIVE